MSMRRRLRQICTIAAVAAIVQACATQTSNLPGRIGFPDGQEDRAPETASKETAAPDPDPLPDLMDADLFSATRDALASHDWIAASLALPRPQEDFAASTDEAVDPRRRSMELWTRYYEARIAFLRGDLDSYGQKLATLAQEALPEALNTELLEHRLEQASLRGDTRTQISLAAQLLAIPRIADDERAVLQSRLWRASQTLPLNGPSAAPGGSDAELQGWLDLATAVQPSDAVTSNAAVSEWLSRYPSHPASELASRFQAAAARDADSRKLTLVVPLSGPLQSAGDAVARGFLAAFYAERSGNIEVSVLDSRRFESSESAYAAARDDGADIVVGPLGKLAVQALTKSEGLDVPLLTLNRGETLSAGKPVLELSLAPEDEAQQLAEWAWAEGARRVLLVRPDSEWGRRMDGALRPHFSALGGTVAVTASYGTASGYSDTIRDALGLGASTRRSATLRNLFEARVETEGRRRNDLDAVFLLCKSSDEARALKPLLNYHFAGDLPVYAISSADTGRNDVNLNRDLGNLRMLALPWRVGSGDVPGFDKGTDTGSLGALHALGADAFALARRWWRTDSTPGLAYKGHTATLLSDEVRLKRHLVLAEFDRGILQPR